MPGRVWIVEGEFVLGEPHRFTTCARVAHVAGKLNQFLDDLRGLDGAHVAADGLLEHLGEGSRLDDIFSLADGQFRALISFCSSSTASGGSTR